MDTWTRQAIDTDASWGAFVTFRDAGPGRKLYQTGTPPQTLRTWYDSHAWGARVLDFDRHMDKVKQAAREARAAAYGASQEEDHRAMLGDARAVAMLEIEKRVKDCLSTEAPTLTIGELAKFLEMVVKYERLQKGQTTEKVGLDLSGLTGEELALALALSEKLER